MGLQDRKRDEEHKAVAVIVCPQHLPQPKNILEGEFALECNQDPSEAEEQIQRIGFLCVESSDNVD